MTKFSKITTLGIVIVVLVVAGFSIWFFNREKIITFEECEKAGYPIEQTSPTSWKCEMSDDKSFIKFASIVPEDKIASLKDVEISLRDWYTHRMSDTYILLTKQQELPDISNTELYAYGEQISINVVLIDTSPEAWVATRIDLEDVLTLNSKWSTYYGQTLLTVESGAGGASGKQYTRYLFTDDVVYMISLYPLEIYDSSSKTYDRNTSAIYDVGRVLFRLRPHILAQESVQRQLAENCVRDISQRIDDSSFDPENKTVTIYLWDEESQDSIALMLPYEPETNFAECSESVKELLRQIQEGQDRYEEDMRSGLE